MYTMQQSSSVKSDSVWLAGQ